MNIADQNPWDQYWKKGGFLSAPVAKPPVDPMIRGGFRQPGAPTGTATVFDHGVEIGNRMNEFKRRTAPPRPAQFDMAGAMSELGGPPQRAPLPDRPGPDTSAGSVISQLFAGASDVMGAAAGRNPQNMARLQALQRQQQDVQYQDSLRKAAVDYDNKMAGWNFQLQKLGADQAASDRAQSRFESDRGALIAEDDRLAADADRDWNRSRITKLDTKADQHYLDMLAKVKRDEEARDRDYNFRLKVYDEGKPGRDFGLSVGQAKEARDKELHDIQVPIFKHQANQITGGGGAVDEKFRALVGAKLSFAEDKMKAANEIIDTINPTDPAAGSKIQMVKDELRRMSPDARELGGTGTLADIADSLPARIYTSAATGGMAVPFHIWDMFFNKGPSVDSQRSEQMERIKRLRAAGIPMEGFAP